MVPTRIFWCKEYIQEPWSCTFDWLTDSSERFLKLTGLGQKRARTTAQTAVVPCIGPFSHHGPILPPLKQEQKQQHLQARQIHNLGSKGSFCFWHARKALPTIHCESNSEFWNRRRLLSIKVTQNQNFKISKLVNFQHRNT